MNIKAVLLVLMPFCLSNINPVSCDSTTSILQFLETQAEQFTLTSEIKDFVFVLGMSGSGKSTLVCLLADYNLKSIETLDGSGEYILIDENDRISKTSTIISKTSVPELVVNKKANTAFIDCPGFQDSRGVASDISVTYLIQKSLNFANRVKFIFAIDHNSVKNRGDRHGFIDLARHATTFIKDIEKYRDGIALIVTKIENRYERKNGNIHLVDDEMMIKGIVQFLQQAKRDLLKRNQENVPSDELIQNNKSIQFIDILIEKNGNQYHKIGIFRLADQSGPVEDIELLQDEKKYMSMVINQNIQYLKKDNADFGTSVSAETKLRLNDLIAEMHERIKIDINAIDNDIKRFYMQQENQIFNQSLIEYCEKMSTTQQNLLKIQDLNDPKLLQQQFSNMKLISSDNADNLRKNLELLDYFTKIHNSSESFEIENSLEKSIEYIDDSLKWYGFLINLHKILSEYNMQHDKNSFDTVFNLMNITINDEQKKLMISDIGLNEFLNQINSKAHFEIENIQLNSIKVKALRSILQQTMLDDIISSCSTDKLIVKGYTVKMSEVNKFQCNAKSIEVFALHKLFIDDDFDRTGQEVRLFMVSPTWEIIGNRKIVLNGANGNPYENHAELGKDGQPGYPGGLAGTFIAVGNRFINNDQLHIYLNGGKGGDGQIGGRGFDGINGTDPPYIQKYDDLDGLNFEDIGLVNCGSFLGFPWRCIHIVLYGTKAIPPGNGGNGGVGGIGGIAGKAFITSFDQQPHFSIEKNSGERGHPGIGGVGGLEAKDGDIWKIGYGRVLYEARISHRISGKWFPRGNSGRDGINDRGIKQPAIVPFHNPLHSLDLYKEYSNEYIANGIPDADSIKFMANLNDTKNIRSIYD